MASVSSAAGDEPPRPQGKGGAIDGLGVLAAGQELPAARDLRQAHAVPVAVELRPDLFERRPHRGLPRLGVEGGELLDRQRPGGRKERRLKQLREGTHAGSPWGRRRRLLERHGLPLGQLEQRDERRQHIDDGRRLAHDVGPVLNWSVDSSSA